MTKKKVDNSWSVSFHRLMDSRGRLLGTGEAKESLLADLQ